MKEKINPHKLEMSNQLHQGTFIERINRFIALVDIAGEAEIVFVPNTGRMKELLVSGAKVLLTFHAAEHRKTKYDLSLVYYNERWVSIDSRLPNILFEYWWNKGCLEPFRDYTYIKKEVPYGNSRLDFRLSSPSGDCYVEVKSVTLVENAIAMFPDAPTERGSRHLRELIKAVHCGNKSAVVFIIQRDDAQEFKPNDQTDKVFGETLRTAVSNGVEAYAFMCSINTDGISYIGQIPVILD